MDEGPCYRHLTWIVLILACFYGLAASCTAADLPAYDLDSVVYGSSEIVEGRFVCLALPGREDMAEVELTTVHRGDLKAGQIIMVAHLDEYVVVDPAVSDQQLSGSEDRVVLYHSRSFKSSDPLFLFLNPVTNVQTFPALPASQIYYNPVGVALVQRGCVLTFAQGTNPGPYEAYTSSQEDPSPHPSVVEFRRLIAERMPEMERLKKRFAAKASVADGPWLLELLRRHRPQKYADPDPLEIMAEDRITQLHNLALLHKAAALHFYNPGWSRYLGGGYDFPAGRKYLLKRIASRKIFMGERVEDAWFLEDAGWPDDPPNRGLRPSGKHAGHGRKAPTPYLTRLARDAWSFRDDTDLCVAILASIKQLTNDSLNGLGGSKELSEARTEVVPIMEKLAAVARSDDMEDEAQQIITYLATMIWASGSKAIARAKKDGVISRFDLPASVVRKASPRHRALPCRSSRAMRKLQPWG